MAHKVRLGWVVRHRPQKGLRWLIAIGEGWLEVSHSFGVAWTARASSPAGNIGWSACAPAIDLPLAQRAFARAASRTSLHATEIPPLNTRRTAAALQRTVATLPSKKIA